MSYESNHPRHPWSRLTNAARLATDERDTSAPFGFSTRIAALAFADQSRMVSLLERFSLRAVGLAALLAIGSIALNYPELTAGVFSSAPVAEEVEVISADDAVAIVLDLGD